MTNVDQFESMFRSASREVFRYEPIDIQSVLVVFLDKRTVVETGSVSSGTH